MALDGLGGPQIEAKFIRLRIADLVDLEVAPQDEQTMFHLKFTIAWAHVEVSTSPIHSFIHSGHFYTASSSSPLLTGAPDYSTDTVSEFYAEAPQATASKGLAQGPYVAARAGVEPTTLRLTVIDVTNAPPRPKFSTVIKVQTLNFFYLMRSNNF